MAFTHEEISTTKGQNHLFGSIYYQVQFLGLALENYRVIGQKFEVGVAFSALPLVLKLSSSGWFRGTAGRGGENVKRSPYIIEGK